MSLAHIGGADTPLPAAPARDPPTSAGDAEAGGFMEPPGEPTGTDPLAQAEPDSIFDQRITW